MSFLDDLSWSFSYKPSEGRPIYKTEAAANEAMNYRLELHLKYNRNSWVAPMTTYLMLRHNGTAVLCQEHGWIRE